MESSPRTIWAYTYRLSPPLAAQRLRRIRALLAEEQALLAAEQQTWEGRLVVDDRVAHILVLATSPDLTREVNRRIEAELGRLGATFTITLPLEVERDDARDDERDDERDDA